MFSHTIRRSFATTMKLSTNINQVVVLGAGSMGSGIAQVIAQSGKKVTLVDQTESLLSQAESTMGISLQRLGKKKFGDDPDAILKSVSETLENVSMSTDPLEASASADLVIESIVEDQEIKRNLLKEVDKVAPPSTIFVSNTSSLLIGTLAEVTNRRDKFAGLHFFNPVPIMKLVEIVSTPEVSQSVISSLQDFTKSIGKISVRCKDTPGFIVNRLLIPHLLDAVLMLERGDATMEDIDLAMKLGCGYPMGPFELIDFTGLDILKSATEAPVATTVVMLKHRFLSRAKLSNNGFGWARDYPSEPSFRTSELLAQKVNEGHVGKKVGKGWYTY